MIERETVRVENTPAVYLWTMDHGVEFTRSDVIRAARESLNVHEDRYLPEVTVFVAVAEGCTAWNPDRPKRPIQGRCLVTYVWTGVSWIATAWSRDDSR